MIVEVPGYGGRYGVTDSGELYSKSIRGTAKRLADDWKPHNTFINSKGYVVTNLTRGGSMEQRKLHHLVLETFVGPCPDGMQACHRNDRKEDNSLQNLYWGSPEENIADKIRNGRVPSGENHCRAKLTESDIRNIRHRRSLGEKLADLAREFNTTASNISNIANRRIWRGVL